MKLVTRQQLGWPTTTAATAPCKSGLVIHYDGAKSPKGVASWEHEACLAYWHWCRRFHMTDANHKWRDIGYSFGCCPHGQILEGRGWGREQAAQPGGNRDWTSVTLMLGDGEDPTPAQIEGVRELRKWLMGKGMAGTVKGHRDFVSTSCPGNRLYARLAEFKKDPTPDKAPEKKEDTVSTTAADVWKHQIKAPWVAPGEDDMWQAATHLRVMHSRVRGLEGKVDGLVADNKAMREELGAVRADLGQVLAILKGQAAAKEG
jgi:hypothetical protein